MNEIKSTWTMDNPELNKALWSVVGFLNSNDILTLVSDEGKYQRFLDSLARLHWAVRQMNTTEEIPF